MLSRESFTAKIAKQCREGRKEKQGYERRSRSRKILFGVPVKILRQRLPGV